MTNVSGLSDAMMTVERLCKRIVKLEMALEPFVALGDQSPSQMAKVIHKDLDGMTPIALTVTKDQFKAALAVLDNSESK